MEVKLVPYHNEEETAKELISQFGQAHGYCPPSEEDASENLKAWTGKGHFLYFINLDDKIAGFVHLGCGRWDCHGDIFVCSEFRDEGINTRAAELAEDIVRKHFQSLYTDADAENVKPIRQYQEIGYSCSAAVTARNHYRPWADRK